MLFCGIFQIRRENLENSIKYFHFCHECDDIEAWIKNKVCLQTCSAALYTLTLQFGHNNIID